ncbi:MAG: tetratricopeptide repeat protein [Mucilaginibacter sp.]|nr:tetratricopeptide repeat protein [Mucilaginibacter sp.]
MKLIYLAILFLTLCCTNIYAQDNDLALAKQYTANGDQQKALDIYLKLYKLDNQAYYQPYFSALINFKKFDEAEGITKKMIRKYPGSTEYIIALSNIYTQQGNAAKAESIFNDVLKSLPSDHNAIQNFAVQFYETGNIDYAIRILKQGRKLLNDNYAFAYELISIYRRKHDKFALTDEYLNILPTNPAYLSQAESVLPTLYDEAEDFDMLRVELLKRIQKDPQQIVYTQMLTWQFLQQKQYDMALNQTLALSRRTNDDGTDVMDLCRTLVASQAYDEAIRGYEFLVEKNDKNNPNYVPAKIELINTRNLKITEGRYTQADLLSLEKDYTSLLTEFGKNGRTVFAMQKLANLQAFKLHKLPDAQALLEQAIKVAGTQPDLLAACKLDLADVYLINKQPWDATLLYSQVEKDNPNTSVAQDAMLRNAKLAYYTGDFNWARRQLDVLKSATTQLIANDALNLSLLISDNLNADTAAKALKIYARADLQIFAEQSAQALQTLDSISKLYPGNILEADVLMAKARIKIQEKDFAGAVLLLKEIAEKHNYDLWADDAVFMLGDIYETQLKDLNLAKHTSRR